MPATHPALPMMNAGLSGHPHMPTRLRYGWKPSPATSRTGNVYADLLLNIGGQFLPKAPVKTFSAGTTASPAQRYGSEFYAQVAGRTAIAEQLAQRRAQLSGLLGVLQQGSPQMQPYIEGLRTSLQDPDFRATLGGIAPIL